MSIESIFLIAFIIVAVTLSICFREAGLVLSLILLITATNIYISTFIIADEISIGDNFFDDNGNNRYITVTILSPTEKRYQEMKEIVDGLDKVSDYEAIKKINEIDKDVKIYIGNTPQTLIEVKK